MDPLSEVLSLLETRDSFFTGLRAGGAWAVAIPRPTGSSSTRWSKEAAG